MHIEYIFTESRFYEPICAYSPNCAWSDLVEAALGDGWKIRRKDFWFIAAPCDDDAASLPMQGFKIHVSADVRRSQQQLLAAVAVLKKHRTAFKFVADQRLLVLTNSKSFPRTSSGKFITVYPASTDAFRAIAGDLRAALADYVGPYVLTDRPVPGSRCVFYRFGAFQGLQCVDAAGRVVHAVRDAEGRLLEDPREPEYRLPPWMVEPFPDVEDESESSDLLGERFEITGAIQFSNIGGVYLGIDTHSGNPVVIKEARPDTGVRSIDDAFTDGREALANEFEKLSLIADLGVAPAPIRLFDESGHTFLAQEQIEGMDWLHFFADDRLSLVPYMGGNGNTGAFLSRFLPVAKSAIESLRKIHVRGLVLGDVSVHNILVNADTHEVRFIDLESAIEDHEPADWRRSYLTPGFVPADRRQRSRPTRADDCYALGNCLLAAILPAQGICDVGSTPIATLVATLVGESGLPAAVAEVIGRLHTADCDGALAALAICEHADVDRALVSTQSRSGANHAMNPDLASGEAIARDVARFISAQYRGADAPMIWPGAPEAAQGGKWNLAHGAAGIAHFLAATNTPLPEQFEQAAVGPEPMANTLDAGLYTGLSGIAYWQVARGAVDIGLSTLEKARLSPQRRIIANVFSGEAGIGIAALSIFRLTGSEQAFELADECARYLVDTAQSDRGGHAYWPDPALPDRAYNGYAYGSAGIGFFLGQFGLASGRRDHVDLAVDALDGVIAQARINARGQIRIGSHRTDNGCAFYWGNGAAGVGSVLARLGRQLSNPVMIDRGVQMLKSAFSKYAVLIGQMDGLAGIWDSMIDGALLTGDPELSAHAEQIRQSIPIYAYRDPGGGICFPGPQNLRLACDFHSGSAGVGSAALRHAHGGPRALFDFALPSVELFASCPPSRSTVRLDTSPSAPLLLEIT